jgi:hypothetical protein
MLLHRQTWLHWRKIVELVSGNVITVGDRTVIDLVDPTEFVRLFLRCFSKLCAVTLCYLQKEFVTSGS